MRRDCGRQAELAVRAKQCRRSTRQWESALLNLAENTNGTNPLSGKMPNHHLRARESRFRRDTHPPHSGKAACALFGSHGRRGA